MTGAWTGVHVNLSHSGDLAAVAVSAGRAVGVDVQRHPPGTDVLAMSARYFPDAEVAHVAGGADPAERVDRFVDLWARKEACVKAAGGKLAQGMPLAVHGRRLVRDPSGKLGGGPYRVARVPVPAGYRAAVALCGAAAMRLTTRWWDG
ncbi:4'-phosphopantetheinyl transferase family protein [Phytohabitans rumicis]|uniref:4'-phosphopantetheinyl transferase domain-containing protein n=1 Tax=Phytohabitans rumicis TaxID=1076125 RepID=A0A6V8KX27_9ACTN|nr:4'-phosphopantetheinyl transferase superfamily protein [Phytohabitans rumicis]GFJ87940.1 hypothetical protein Prum_015820 [Phytohabitans rumicis]